MNASLGPGPTKTFRPQPHAAFMPDLPAGVVGVLPFYNDDSGKRLAQFVLIAALIEIFGIAFVVGGAWLLLMLLQLLGIKIPLFDSLAMKPRDIEFVLVEAPTAKPRHPTKNRAEHATRAGGQKVKNLNQAESHKAAGTPKPQKAARPAPTPQPQQRPQPQRPQQRPAVTQRPSQQPSQQPTPQPPTPRPTPRPPAPKLPVPKVANNTSPMFPPSPHAPTIRTPAAPSPRGVGSGPIVPSGPIGTSSGGSSGSSGSPGPTQIPGALGGGRSGGGSRGGVGGPQGQGGSGRDTQYGSPGGGGGRPGIDAEAEPDFGPYIAELQRRIKRNWQPPADNRNKRIVALFTIGRDGRLISIRIDQSSGVQVADEAALMAVRASAPFRPLPANFKGRDIDVQFIFDYNVYSGAKMR